MLEAKNYLSALIKNIPEKKKSKKKPRNRISVKQQKRDKKTDQRRIAYHLIRKNCGIIEASMASGLTERQVKTLYYKLKKGGSY